MQIIIYIEHLKTRKLLHLAHYILFFPNHVQIQLSEQAKYNFIEGYFQ